MLVCTLERSWHLREGRAVMEEEEEEEQKEEEGQVILRRSRAALDPLRPGLDWDGTREPVWVSLDRNSCCSSTLSLAVEGEQERRVEGEENEEGGKRT